MSETRLVIENCAVATVDGSAMGVRQALKLGTIHGARCLGREIGSLEPGKLADVALWRLDDLGHSRVEDFVAVLVLGPPRPVELLLVNGEPVVEGGELKTADEPEIARRLARASERLAGKTRKPRR
jgi:imidazolonepropionase-like amidohydrolase